MQVVKLLLLIVVIIVALPLVVVAAALAIPLLVLLSPLIVLWLIVRALTGGRKQAPRDADEARLMQEIYHGLAGMEKRIGNLETILLERSRKAAHVGNRTDL